MLQQEQVTNTSRKTALRQEWRQTVREIMDAEQGLAKGQRHTAKTMFDHLVAEHGYRGSLRTVQYLITEWRWKFRKLMG